MIKDSDYDKAKEMYFLCRGNRCSLDRNYGEEYKKLHVPKEVEREWKTEIFRMLKNNIETKAGYEKFCAVFELSDIIASDEAIMLISREIVNKNNDDFSTLIYCELYKHFKKNCREDLLIKTAKDSLLSKYYHNSFVIDKSYHRNLDDANIKRRIDAL